MSGLALALVLGAAVLYATWNLLAKRVGEGGASFILLFTVAGVILYAPVAVAVVLIQKPAFGPPQLLFIAGSAALHVGYFALLQNGYKHGDLSLVYPLARGSGPVLATGIAVALLAERPSPLAVFGALLIAGGAFTMSRGRKGAVNQPVGVLFGLLTGVTIALYSVWDKHAVSSVGVPPLILDWGTNLLMIPFFGAWIAKKPSKVREIWGAHRLEVLGVALLCPLAYILVLTAMVFTPVSYVAPAREVSILVGAVLGARLLREGDVARRLSAAGMIVAGIAALALG